MTAHPTDRQTIPAYQHARYASVLIDYDNYYKALHSAIVKAEKSIFLIGWDIDSRIELVRGAEAETTHVPRTFYDLIIWKAQENPDLQIYLNRWDFSMFFASKRELFQGQKWRKTNLKNIHFVMDGRTTVWGCHHQKIAVIDDVVAFSGGMDVTQGRWDRRQHHVTNKFRDSTSPDEAIKETCPFHDIHCVFAGETVADIADWVRKRWTIATGNAPIDRCPTIDDGLPSQWPDTVDPHFENIALAQARTMPHTFWTRQIEEILPLLLQEIRQAEQFIYIENQYLCNMQIAEALYHQLKTHPDLKILMISSYDPNGYLEKIAMWGGRIRFLAMLQADEDTRDRVLVTYPICVEKKGSVTIRIHSKIMVIDDRLLHIGSANLNNRSMGFDTEYDIALKATTETHKTQITATRDDLIREHTGHTPETIAKIIKGDLPLNHLEGTKPGSRQHLIQVNDDIFRTSPFVRFLTLIADPRRPFFYTIMTSPFARFLRKKAMVIAAVLFAIGLALLWTLTPISQYTDTEMLREYLQMIRGSPFAPLWLVGLYILCALIFFPVTVLSGAVILLFGGLLGFVYATIGGVIGALVGYGVGYKAGLKRLRKTFPKVDKTVNAVHESGVIGMTVIRMIPIAPFSVVNMVLGAINVPVGTFIAGTVLGMASGKVILALFGDTIIEVFTDPTPRKTGIAIFALIAWCVIVWLCNKFARQWQSKHQKREAQA